MLHTDFFKDFILFRFRRNCHRFQMRQLLVDPDGICACNEGWKQ